MAPRGNLLLPSPAAFRSRDPGPQLTISGRVFLAGRAKRWEAQVRFASPISAVLGITDAARPRGGGSGARDSVPAAGPRLGVGGQREFECRRGRKAVPHRPHPRCSVPVGWGRGLPDGCPDMARRHHVRAGPRGSARVSGRGPVGGAPTAAGAPPSPEAPSTLRLCSEAPGGCAGSQRGGGPGPSTGSRPSAGPGRSADPRV